MSEDEGFFLVDENPLPDPPAPPQLVAVLKTWLQPTDYLGESSEFQRHFNSLVPGTCEWLWTTSQYKQWHDGAAGALWVKAIAAAGKSVLAARLISQLQIDNAETPVLFFFFRQIVASNHDMNSLARDWLAQLLDFSSFLRMELAKWKENQRTVTEIAFQDLWKLLIHSLAPLNKFYCVVDALDELDGQQTPEFLLQLVELGRLRPAALRLEARQTNNDIGLFIQHQLRLAHHVNEVTKETIRKAGEDRVHPSFLYARLLVNEILDGHGNDTVDAASAQSALLRLPASLEHMYTQMLHDHSQLAGVPQDRQRLILQLVTHAARPLRLLEIAAILGFLESTEPNTTHGDLKNLMGISCGPLLEISSRDCLYNPPFIY
ncbi:hypothetical protein BJX70DRAFT_403704 [Aspergillus crustosus]